MQVSKLIMLLEKKIREADVTEKMQDELSTLSNSIPANLRAKKSRAHADDDDDDDKDKKKSKQLKDKKDNKKSQMHDVEEQDSPFDAFDDQLKKKAADSSDMSEYLTADQIAQQTQTSQTKKAPKFNLDNAKNFEVFKDLVNKFRASDSINKSDATKKYYDKLTAEEKQYACLLFDALSKTLNSVENPEFVMPKTPKQYGLSVTSSKEQQQQHQQQHKAVEKKTVVNNNTQKPIASKEDKPKVTATNPIVVGESKNRNMSIENLLKGIK